MGRQNLISGLRILWKAPRVSVVFIMLGRLNSHELRPLVDPGVFFAEKIDLSSRRNNAISYIFAILGPAQTLRYSDHIWNLWGSEDRCRLWQDIRSMVLAKRMEPVRS